MLFKYPLSQIVRKILDAPFQQKGVVFWLLIPILFLIAFVVACVGRYRRYKGYVKIKNVSHTQAHYPRRDSCLNFPDNLQILCIGNILIGGTGKSPLVRKFAQEYLKRHSIVAIAARGINASNPIIINSINFLKEDLNKLSDENREHFELLKHQYPEKQFFIFQNSNRQQSLLDYIEIISKNPNQNFMLILDDGLQHYSCPRHVNICVCDAKLNETAPHHSWPIGPYREGFGKHSIQKILSSFDMRIWTNQATSNDAATSFPKSIFTFPENFKDPIETHDLFAKYILCFVKFVFSDAQNFSFESIQIHQIESSENNRLLMIAGIAHPDKLISDLKIITQKFDLFDACILDDHGTITQQCIEKIQKSDTIILTLKDFFDFVQTVIL